MAVRGKSSRAGENKEPSLLPRVAALKPRVRSTAAPPDEAGARLTVLKPPRPSVPSVSEGVHFTWQYQLYKK